MPILLGKHAVAQRTLLRDVRPVAVRLTEFWTQMDTVAVVGVALAVMVCVRPIGLLPYADILAVVLYRYFKWVFSQGFSLPFKFPRFANLPDPHNPKPGAELKKTASSHISPDAGAPAGKSEGVMFIGNINDPGDPSFGKELWLTTNDVRTHIVYLGTTGSGKTEGLKSIVCNSLSWGSGFVYVDGKADTDLWTSLYALARRFGRDDDLLILNYMTANSDNGATSNTMNPFATGSASYLSNMVVSLMPDAGGDNAMWKERAVALLSALMPALTWKRDKQGLLLDVGVVREYIELKPIVSLSRDQNMPERIVRGLQGYLNTLPGYVDAAFDDEGNERPPSPDQPMYDLQVARQQHGYLSMQFTRSLQSLADEYGYIFKVQLADVDVLDVVLNRRILVALIPSLEKSADEASNLGKIVAASLKGMMGATLGNTVEGSWEMAIGSKQTRSNSSFITVFDEVGYYTAPGMAVMAAQARSLGFAMVFAAQDLPSMEKRIKQEAQSILANCNLKIFGKIEDPTETKEFLSKHAGDSWVMETQGASAPTSTVSSLFMNSPFLDNRATAGGVPRSRVSYDHLRGQREGQAHMFFGDWAVRADIFYSNPPKVSAIRVQKLLAVPATTTATAARERAMHELAARLKDPDWSAEGAQPAAATSTEIAALVKGLALDAEDKVEAGILALSSLVNVVADVPAAPSAPSSAAATPNKASDARKPVTIEGEKKPAKAETVAPATEKKISATSTVAALSTAEKAKAKANLPSFQEGDQFSIEQLEAFLGLPPKATATPQASTQAKAAKADEGKSHQTISREPSFVPTDVEVKLVTPPTENETGDVLQTKLSPEVADLLQQSAEKINRGLGGGNITDAAE